MLPTVLDLLRLPPHPAAMGRSLVPLMTDGAEAGERYAFSEPFLLGSNDPVNYWWEGEGTLTFRKGK